MTLNVLTDIRSFFFKLLTMVNAGGTWTCVHSYVSRLLYHNAMDADKILFLPDGESNPSHGGENAGS